MKIYHLSYWGSAQDDFSTLRRILEDENPVFIILSSYLGEGRSLERKRFRNSLRFKPYLYIHKNFILDLPDKTKSETWKTTMYGFLSNSNREIIKYSGTFDLQKHHDFLKEIDENESIDSIKLKLIIGGFIG